jgi:hypothetical protein
MAPGVRSCNVHCAYGLAVLKLTIGHVLPVCRIATSLICPLFMLLCPKRAAHTSLHLVTTLWRSSPSHGVRA